MDNLFVLLEDENKVLQALENLESVLKLMECLSMNLHQTQKWLIKNLMKMVN